MSSQNENNVGRGDMLVASLEVLVAARIGERLPSERALASQFKVSRGRLRAALAAMQQRGLIASRRGSGTFAVSPDESTLETATLLVDSELKLADDPFFSALVERLQAALQSEKIDCRIRRIDAGAPDYNTPDSDVSITLGRAGRQVASSTRAAGEFARPVVALMPGEDVRPSDRVSVFHLDDFDAGGQAAAGLIGRGVSHLIFVGRKTVDASRRRFEGAQDAAQAAKIPITHIEAHLNYVGGVRAADAVQEGIANTPGSIAVITSNDWLAVGLRAGLVGTHVELPIVSFDGLSLAAEPELGITSFAIPIAEIARDTVAEIKRLCQSSWTSGRSIIYRLTEPQL